jgi:alpha-D-ribose 1-methylphosphonate 5-triphosphate synthase subunit PhnG
MVLRKQLNPREMDLQPEMRDILLRNGMQAHIIANGDNYQLAVQGHDSPLLTYNLTEKQMLALTDWGTNTANKKAWNVFTNIVSGDFYMPRNFVHARNANGRVAMGLHGYRVGDGEYGRGMWGPSILGWTPRQQDGMHLRRVGGQVFFAGPMMVERPDRRLKPGELQSGGYCFYYRGQQQPQAPQQDVLQDLQSVISPIQQRPRSTEPAKPYKELITSPVYFSNEKWQEVLSSHGIVIDPEKKTLTVQSSSTDMDMVYDLKDEELKMLTDNSIKKTPIAKRLEILNGIIGSDFQNKITMDILNSKERISIALKPEVLAQLQQSQQDQNQKSTQQVATVQNDLYNNENSVDGRNLELENDRKGWYREGKHGREVEVTGITAYRTDVDGQYVMTAQINGQTVSHEITQKQYDKFMALDDYHRMKLFSSIFKEVDMKTRPEARSNLGSQILGALTAGAVVAGEVAHGFHRPPPQGGDLTIINVNGHAPRPYFKPGVDSPNDIAARNFEAMANHVANEMRNGRGL